MTKMANELLVGRLHVQDGYTDKGMIHVSCRQNGTSREVTLLPRRKWNLKVTIFLILHLIRVDHRWQKLWDAKLWIRGGSYTFCLTNVHSLSLEYCFVCLLVVAYHAVLKLLPVSTNCIFLTVDLFTNDLQPPKVVLFMFISFSIICYIWIYAHNSVSSLPMPDICTSKTHFISLH